MKKTALVFICCLLLSIMVVITSCETITGQTNTTTGKANSGSLPGFNSEEELVNAFIEAHDSGFAGYYYSKGSLGRLEMVPAAAAQAATSDGGNQLSYSDTNIQVAGVDEADIVKTDGKFIYLIAQNRLYIAEAYPADSAKILTHLGFPDFHPQELYIDGDRLMVFGTTYYPPETYTPNDRQGFPPTIEPEVNRSDAAIMPVPIQGNLVSVKLIDIEDRSNPNLLKSVDVEGTYLTSRMVGTDVYFVINSYPGFISPKPSAVELIPGFRETTGDSTPSSTLDPIAKYSEIGYIPPRQATNFVTVASLSIQDAGKEMVKTVIVGSGENVFASLDNLYIAQTSWPSFENLGEPVEDSAQSTVITKFNFSNGNITYQATNTVKGHILNQFAMDEHDGYFRIATTISGYVDNRDTSTNNVYTFDGDLNEVGALEDLAPGESIYSVRFMGKRAYLVTFRHVDPLFVIDLSEPSSPRILGKLKIPGYSEYLHLYDETHLIGIGKEVDASIDADLIHTENAVYYTAIQGVKLALFDVSDVSNPIEVYKEVIGDRGTQTLAAQDHKAFLFDKERGLLVIPITLAELKPGQPKNMQGEYTFQGAYVYNLSLTEGFTLEGRVTHYDSNGIFQKSGEYFYGGQSDITRSLYINNTLYTLSQSRLQANDLTTMEPLAALALIIP